MLKKAVYENDQKELSYYIAIHLLFISDTAECKLLQSNSKLFKE